ncbi:MAG: response regulator [Anaerolineae bacterium]|nr:response regulator [Anaerolineae bacterium]
MLTRETFIEYLRDGLNHLHDAKRLRQNPLVALLGVAHRPDAASALRNTLIKAVESLKPSDDAPSRSRDWRLYDSLFYYYVQQLDQRIVADQLALSVRHLRREQRAALEVLADKLWEQFDLETKSHEDAGKVPAPAQATPTRPLEVDELAWLKDLPSEKPTDLNKALSEILDLARPLLTQHNAGTKVTIDGDLPNLAVHPVALDQILLSLLNVAIPRSAGGVVQIKAEPLHWAVEVQVQSSGTSASFQPVQEEDASSLEVARQLTVLCGGKLSLEEDSAPFSVVLSLPALEQLPVLAIDDNADTLQLLQRYTAGTRFRLVGTSDPEQALDLAEKLCPQIIVLDVMMPEVDGWKVMSMLRQHPLTSHIPIVVCTILAQENLALALGASGFVQKPVTRQALLEALNHQAEMTQPASAIESR